MAGTLLRLPNPVQRIRQIREWNDARPSAPGEHWFALGLGVGLWLLTRRSPSPIVRTLGLLGGSALVTRAASGRDGVARVVRWLPVGRGVRT